MIRTNKNRFEDAINKSKSLRTIGFDDAPFIKGKDAQVNVSGIVCTNTRFEGMIWTTVTQDGLDATESLINAILNSKFHPQLHAVLIDGIAFGGFNIVDLSRLSEATQLPCITVMRKLPDKEAIKNALLNLPDHNKRWSLIEQAGEIKEHSGFIYQHTGIDEGLTAKLLQKVTYTGKVPEPLRLAHLIGSAIKTGQSSNRA